MADKRMFSKAIIDSDKFIDLPLSTQALYFHLAMRADDDGFVNCSNRIRKTIEASTEDMQRLEENGFIISFESGIVVIVHWHLHNTLKNDRYKKTIYQNEKSRLVKSEAKVYRLADCIQSGSKSDTNCIQSGSKSDTQIRKAKTRGEDDSRPEDARKTTTKEFVPPSLEEVLTYCSEKGYSIDASAFHNYYESNGWMVGKNKMKDWRAAVRTWVQREMKSKYSKESPPEDNDKPDLLDSIM